MKGRSYIIQDKKGNRVEIEYYYSGQLKSITADEGTDVDFIINGCDLVYQAPSLAELDEFVQQVRQKQKTKKPADRVTITVSYEDVSFDTFWNAYGKKIHKDRAEKAWAKLGSMERSLALSAIKKTQAYYTQGKMTIPFPASYINSKLFKDFSDGA